MRSLLVAVLAIASSALAQPAAVSVAQTFYPTVIDYYGSYYPSLKTMLESPQGLIWAKAVCDYNIANGHHTIDTTCTVVEAQERVYLPVPSVVQCTIYKMAGQACPLQTSDERFVEYQRTTGATQSQEIRRCMQSLELANPGRTFNEYLLIAAMLKRDPAGYARSGEELARACGMTVNWSEVIGCAPLDYIRFNQHGVPEITMVL